MESSHWSFVICLRPTNNPLPITHYQSLSMESKDLQSQPMPLLSASGLTKSFGGIKAVDNADLEVAKGSITGLIGPNGAGKTTLFNLLSNFIRPDRGWVIFDGAPVQQLRTYQIADRKSTRLNSSHSGESRMPSSA